MGGGSGGPISDPPGSSMASVRFEVEVPERRLGMLNSCCLKCRIFRAEAGEAGGYARCLTRDKALVVCGPGVHGGERGRFGRRRVDAHIHLAQRYVVVASHHGS